LKRKKCSYHYVEVMACPSGLWILVHAVWGWAHPSPCRLGVTSMKSLSHESSLTRRSRVVWGGGRGLRQCSLHIFMMLAWSVSPLLNIALGCVNGGGQIRPQDGKSSKELYTEAEAIYSSVR
jgi:hypothetical protein